MSERSDHLIERAASLLKSAQAKRPSAPDDAGPTGTSPSSPEIATGPGRKQLATIREPDRRRPGAMPTATQARAKTNERVSELRKTSPQDGVSIAAMERAGLMVARLTRTRTTEEYRIVIGRVLRALHEAPNLGDESDFGASPNVLMVTSARPGEGKSFTSLNLGGSLAQNAGESVLLVDVDAKNNSLSESLGLSDRKGFLDLVADPSLQLDDLIVPSDLSNLSFLPIGTRTQVTQDGEPAGTEERQLVPPIRRLAERFPQTLILLDAPPCLSTSDPHALSPCVGQVVVVVEAERTQRSEVEAAIDMIRVCPTITILLNKVRMTSSHTFGTYDYFGTYS